jgi:phage-related minor tail protein
MAAPNLFEELKKALQEFKDFLTTNVPVIKPAIQALKQVVPQITDLIDKLIDLLGKLKTEIQNLNVGAIPNLDKVSQFTQGVTALLTAAKNLLPDDASQIDDVLAVASVAGSLPTVGQVKDEITSLIDTVIGQLNTLKA